MKRTFINQNSEKNIEEVGMGHLESRIEDFKRFMEARDLEDAGDDLGSFYDYGLSFDYVELGTFKPQEEDYFRYQLSWGGGSDEVRFFVDGTMEYVYLDWFCGVGFDVTREDWAIWLKDWFSGGDMLNFQEKREGYDYYEQLWQSEHEDEEDEEE